MWILVNSTDYSSLSVIMIRWFEDDLTSSDMRPFLPYLFHRADIFFLFKHFYRIKIFETVLYKYPDFCKRFLCPIVTCVWNNSRNQKILISFHDVNDNRPEVKEMLLVYSSMEKS